MVGRVGQEGGEGARKGDADLHHCGSSVQSLPPEDPTEGAVVLGANLLHNFVHGPAIQLLIGHHLQRNLVLLLVTLDCLQ